MSNRWTWVGRGAAAALGCLGQDCALCGATSVAELVCEACTGSLPKLPERCPRCALPAPRGAVCGTCLANPPHFDGTAALWPYEFPADRLVQALKYRAWLGLASYFARQLARHLLPPVDLIVPMPLHPARLASRGFNQALEIARVLAALTGLPLASRGTQRVRNTVPQADLLYEERTRNIRGAFAARIDFAGRTVAVVDDVMTTGATLNELARTIKRAGAAGVQNLVVARAVLR
jgi:ComF family protein